MPTSLVMVVPTEGLDSVTLNVSSSSFLVSPTTVTAIVLVVSTSANVTMPIAGA